MWKSISSSPRPDAGRRAERSGISNYRPDDEQTFLYVADGTNQRVWILRRKDLEILDSFGRRGRAAGEFHWLHKFVVDSKGNIYTGEVHMQRRLQKFVLQESSLTE